MRLNDFVPPSLSTAQDESTFAFSKIDKKEIKRNHLNVQPGESYTSKIDGYYSINEIVDFLKQTDEDGVTPKYRRITLQFPDSLVCDSAAVAKILQSRLGLDLMDDGSSDTSSSDSARAGSKAANGSEKHCGQSDNQCCKSNKQCCQSEEQNSVKQRLWILADTTYSSCCVDEVAAEHVKADLLLHFGDACLNSVSKLSCAYVFGRPHIDEDSLIEKFEERYPEEEFKHSKIVLMADAPHTYVLLHIAEKLRLKYPTLAYGDVTLEENSTARIIGYSPRSDDPKAYKSLNRTFIGIQQDSEDQSPLQEYELFHITKPETPRLLQLTTKFQSVTIFDPTNNKTSQGPYPNLMRRYRYMHMARSAGTIGVLVNTLSLANTRELIKAVGSKIKDAGKKHYIFVVGKPNVAKLANFDAIDLWCILGCDHQGIIIDQTNEYFKPIVTPYELLLALSDELTWTGQWVTDFRSILNDIGDDYTEQDTSHSEAPSGDEESGDEAPDFDPVTGSYVSSSRPLRRMEHLQIGGEEEHLNEKSDKSLVQRMSGTVSLKNTVSTSAAHLQNRQWTGLGSDFQEDVDPDGAVVEEGGSGIARGYTYDREHAING